MGEVSGNGDQGRNVSEEDVRVEGKGGRGDTL